MIVVTGSNGQLGSELRDIIKKDVIFLNRSDLDLTNEDAIRSLISKMKITTLINTAAYTQVDKAESEQEIAKKINHMAPAVMAELAVEKKFKFIHFSTDYVFAGNSITAYREDDETNPIGVYGNTKRNGEVDVLKVCPEAAIIRTSWVYSKYGKNFIKTILKAGSEREELRVVSDQIGTLTNAASLASVTLEIIKLNLSGVYHYSGEGVSSWYDVAILLKKLSGFKARVVPVSTSEYPTIAKRPCFSLLDKRKIKNALEINVPSWIDELDLYFRKSL